MRRAIVSFGFGSLAWLPLLVVWACSGGGGSAQPPPDGDDSDAQPDVPDEFSVPDGPNPEGGSSCTVGIAGMTTDPVALCFQGDLLTAEVAGAYVNGQGVAQTWDDSGHTSGHAWQDDLGLASAIASFECSAEYYGNADYLGRSTLVLGDLAKCAREGAARGAWATTARSTSAFCNAEAGYNYLNDEAKRRRLPRPRGRLRPNPPDLLCPGRSIRSLDDAGSTRRDHRNGTPDRSGGVDYAPAQAIMAAAALLDMAVLYGSDPDAGAPGPRHMASSLALAALGYVWSRGRDPVTGLFYQALVTSNDAGHDALLPGTPTSDALLTDVQATAVLGLSRVQTALDTLQADALTLVALTPPSSTSPSSARRTRSSSR